MNKENYHCKWRIELAKQISDKIRNLRGNKGIKSIAVGGSVARGYADEYSDIEILIFWDILPNEDIRKQIVKGLNADYFYPYNYEANEDNIIVNEFRIDLWHLTLDQEEEVIKTVTKDFVMDLYSSNAMDTIRTCIPLYGEKVIYPWKDDVKEYPKQIALNNINEILHSIDCTQIELLLKRENSTLLFEHITNLQKNIYLIILSLNKEYFPTFKWMYKSLENLRIKPENIGQRFKDTYTYAPQTAIENTLIILSETIEQVNEIYPEINTNIILSKLVSARIAHEHPVSI
jgi:hypothetical protein